MRNEVMDDIKGQKTRCVTLYISHGIGLTYWFNKYITVRPELRFEQSYQGKAYDRGHN
ncbi:MAG: hypothetical protein K2X66_17010 [Cyanobacteria bacterium]|nr:hypothetical protein [Cyanobacteriota bacterium]